MRAISEHRKELIEWLKTSLAFWAEHGRDHNNGWYEHLTREKAADIDAIRRHRVQARQVYCYSIAAINGWLENSEQIIDETFNFMVIQGWNGENFIHRMNRDYIITDDRCDLYDHAFYLLAAASAFAATGDKTYRKWVDKIISVIDKMRQKNGGWSEDDKGSLPRRQNPHMHLFEAHLYLYEATAEPEFLDRANESLTLFKRYFYDADVIAIREFFNADWSLDAKTGNISEPGHAAEWIWLLGWYDRLTGADHKEIRLAIYHSLALQAGPYLIDERQAPDHAATRSTRRLWGQTEWIKAHLAVIEDGYTPAVEMLPMVLEHFTKDYLDPDGTWNDQFNNKGQDIAKTIPVSSMYHIVAMILELNRVAD